MARQAVDITAGATPVEATKTEVTAENIVSAEAAQGEIVQLSGPGVIQARLDEQTREILMAMDSISPKCYVRGFEDPAYPNGFRKVEAATAGEVTWLGRWFQKVGLSYHPVAIKVLKKGSIVSQAHQVVPQKDRDGKLVTDANGNQQYREIQTILFETVEQEQAFNKLVAVLPEYLLAMKFI